MELSSHLSEPIREVVLVVADHGVPAVHQQPQPGPLPRPDGNMKFDWAQSWLMSVSRVLQGYCTWWSLFSELRSLRTEQRMHWHCPPMLVREHTQRTVSTLTGFRSSNNTHSQDITVLVDLLKLSLLLNPLTHIQDAHPLHTHKTHGSIWCEQEVVYMECITCTPKFKLIWNL